MYHSYDTPASDFLRVIFRVYYVSWTVICICVGYRCIRPCALQARLCRRPCHVPAPAPVTSVLIGSYRAGTAFVCGRTLNPASFLRVLPARGEGPDSVVTRPHCYFPLPWGHHPPRQEAGHIDRARVPGRHLRCELTD